MKHIIVSPSGKMYGSEQVLIDYLKFSKGKFSIFVGRKDALYRKLKLNFNKHSISYFNNTTLLYIKLLFLCFAKKVSTIYVNEAGHSKYISLLSGWFPRVRFIIHVRLVEDAGTDRWPFSEKAPNLIVVSVSRFLKDLLPMASIKIYDPYTFRFEKHTSPGSQKDKLDVGVIGRISVTKGIDRIIRLLEMIQAAKLEHVFQFHFFGDVMPDVIKSDRFEKLQKFSNISIRGFETDLDRMFNALDCVIHASGKETLGRIFLEAIDFGKPFIGINEGGIGEIGNLLELNTLLVEGQEADYSELLFQKLLFLRDNYESSVKAVNAKKNLAAEIFSPHKYAQNIDSLVLQPIQ